MLRDAAVSGSADVHPAGLAVRVIVGGTWGFASSSELTTDAARATATRAVAVARMLRAVSFEPVERADEPVHRDVSWVSDYQIDPWTVPTEDKIGVLAEWSARLLAADGIDHVGAACPQVKERSA